MSLLNNNYEMLNLSRERVEFELFLIEGTFVTKEEVV